MFEQLTIFDLINPEEQETADGAKWTTLCVDKEQGIYRFPKETGEWQQVEVLIKRENDTESGIERWLYRDYTFKSTVPAVCPEKSSEIIKWRLNNKEGVP